MLGRETNALGNVMDTEEGSHSDRNMTSDHCHHTFVMLLSR
jgi:hypothetical protein